MTQFTLLAAATTGGGSEFENRYGLDLCLRSAVILLLAAVYPPAAPPSALPSVELIMSTRPGERPKCASVPRPPAPKKPVAWQSSTNTRASYLYRRKIDYVLLRNTMSVLWTSELQIA